MTPHTTQGTSVPRQRRRYSADDKKKILGPCH